MQSLALPLFALLAVFGATNGATTWTPPALAYIVAGGKYQCAATIIDDYFAITAGSCIESLDVNTTDVYVRVGTTAKSGSYVQSIKVNMTYVDDSSSGPNAVKGQGSSATLLGMVQVESRFEYGKNVKWASPTFQTISTSVTGYMSLWSGTKGKSATTTAEAKAISSSSCSSYLDSVTLNSTQTCLTPAVSTSYPCKADLGAPFFRNGLLYGVVTYSLGCSTKTNPAIVTNLGDANDFILESIIGTSGSLMK